MLSKHFHRFLYFTKSNFLFAGTWFKYSWGKKDFAVKHIWMHLEAELLEEPLVLATLVSVLETHTDLETCLLTLDWVFQVLHAVFALETHFWNTVTSGHQVIVVDKLKWRNSIYYLVFSSLIHCKQTLMNGLIRQFLWTFALFIRRVTRRG